MSDGFATSPRQAKAFFERGADRVICDYRTQREVSTYEEAVRFFAEQGMPEDWPDSQRRRHAAGIFPPEVFGERLKNAAFRLDSDEDSEVRWVLFSKEERDALLRLIRKEIAGERDRDFIAYDDCYPNNKLRRRRGDSPEETKLFTIDDLMMKGGKTPDELFPDATEMTEGPF